MIDIHNHIIPGIDDGAIDMSMALAMLQMAQEQGVQRLVCTPHMHAGRYDNNQSNIQSAFASLQQAASDAELTIELAMGAEVRISDEFMVQLIRGQVPFIGWWQEKRAVLLEMPHDSIPVGMTSLLRWQVALPVLMLLLYLVFSSYRLLVADINHQHVNRYLEYWKQEFSENEVNAGSRGYVRDQFSKVE